MNRDMATFYSSATNQRDTMPTLYLREQQHAYSDTSASGNTNMLYMNYPSSSPYPDMLTGSNDSRHNCVGLPASANMISQDSSMVEHVASCVGEPSYNTSKNGRNGMLYIQTIGGSISAAVDLQMSIQSPLGISNGQNFSLQQSDILPLQGQGLSLSLGTQIPVSSFQYPLADSDISILTSHQSISGNDGSCQDDDSRNRVMNASLSRYAHSHLMSTIPNSKYLKTVQWLLNEVVNIPKTLKHRAEKSQSLINSGTSSCKGNDGVSKSDTVPLKPQESKASERQDLQNKLTKLLSMLDEVDRKYKQYSHQMQILVSSFDIIAGSGAATPYTALALQTISEQFRNLRDAINVQIRPIQNSLGEQDNSSRKGGVITRLRYIDQHLRQQMAMPQLGIFQHHAWRPQRGLPGTSISILRAWLFEHFLHPYPTESEKLMLSRQTSLTRSQISNWFINARVRLWKPMIEEMYKDENENKSLSENTKEREDPQRSTIERHGMNQFGESPKSNHASKTGMGEAAVSFQNSATEGDAYMNLKSRDQRNEEDCSLLHDALAHSDGSARFMTCHMAELGKYAKKGVSLTLGLQHFDGSIPISSTQEGFLAMREDMYNAANPLGAEVADYDCMNLADQQNRFGSSHLHHDFVA